MNWENLNDLIPWVTPEDAAGSTVETAVLDDGPRRVWVQQPGRHWDQTYSPGGDFHVRVDSPRAQTLAQEQWRAHGFSHAALFADFESKAMADASFSQRHLAPALVQVVAEGADPEELAEQLPPAELPGLEANVCLVASQCLALAEHRRYRKYEPETGRCLPLRLSLGIMFKVWNAASASNFQKKGRGALAILRGTAKRSEPALSEVLGRTLRSNAACEDEALNLARKV